MPNESVRSWVVLCCSRAVVVVVLAFGWSVAGSALPDSVKAGDGQNKVRMCHVADNGDHVELTIGAPGAANHLKNHPDDSPGECGNNCSAGYACDDGNLCTQDRCLADNTCDFGRPVDCSDGNVCTRHECEPEQGCFPINLDGLICDDGDVCTVVDICSGGTCSGTPVDYCCVVDTDCNHDDLCEPKICVNRRCVVNQDHAVQCTSPHACVVTSECVEGQCEELAKSCEDTDLCTINEACDPVTGRCTSEPKPCDPGYVCEAGECIPVFSCSEEGILQAIVAGSAAAFDCDAPTLVPVTEEIVIVNDVVFHGADNLILEGDGTHRMLAVPQGVTVELHGVTIVGGGSAENGGAVYNEGTLIMRGGAVTGNHATKGGGVYNVGALSIYSTDESFMDNTALYGGGIYNDGYAVVTNATVARNTAELDGGGIYNDGSLILTNSTVSQNQAVTRGGGIFSVGPELEMASNTMVDNTASLGSAIWLRTQALPALFRNNLIVGDCEIEGADVFSMGYNMQGPGDTCHFDDLRDFPGMPSDLMNVGPLQDNGGPRRADGSAPLTHALQAGSWGIDEIPPADCADTQGLPLSTDARGVRRPQGIACDIGAVEGSSVFPCDEHGLRAAIATGGGPLTFDCAGPTTVSAGALILIDNDVILDGGGNLILDGDDSHRVLFVRAGVTAELVGFTVSGGGGGYGSGIYNEGTLTFVDGTVSHNVGGGIINYGTLAVANSVLVHNTGAISGGAIANWALLTVTDSTVADNTSVWDGGIGNTAAAARATLSRTTITRNTATSQTTGGVGIGPGGEMTLTDCTVSGNHAPQVGGVGPGPGSTVTLVNTTVSGNTADTLGGGIGAGGTLVVTNSTVSGNSAGQAAGGIGITENGAVTLINTTVVGNTAAVASAIGTEGTAMLTLTNTLIEGDCFSYDQLSSIHSGGHNIESPGNTCGLDQSTDKVGDDPMLGPLEDNGGLTETHAPLPGSIAINAIPIEACAVGTDQRGVERPQPEGGFCDVGAVEARDWPIGSPESQGFDSDALATLVKRIHEINNARTDLFRAGVDSLLIIRNGVLIFDAYFYPYLGDRPHDVASVTKTITSTMTGLAIEQGFLTSVDETIWPLFEEEYPDIPAVDRKDEITIKHLLNLASGFDCGEYESDGEALIEMLASDDWVRHVLELGMIYPPGTQSVYCSPAVHLLSAAAVRRSGQTAPEFVDQYLFSPLGIDSTTWHWPSEQGVLHGWGALRLHPHAMAKLGQLFLHQGTWKGVPVLSPEWVEQATSPSDVDWRIGYIWWLLPYHTALEGSYRASGRGGQHIIVHPDEELVIVSTGGGNLYYWWAPYLMDALRPETPLPENEDAHQRLLNAIADAKKPPDPVDPGELPPIATEISGTIYRLDENHYQVRCISVHFDGPDPREASIDITVVGRDGTLEEFTLPIGMDGVPRFSEEEVRGFQIGTTGEWTSDTVFTARYDALAGVERLDVTCDFDYDMADVGFNFFDRTAYFEAFNNRIVPGHLVDGDTCPAE